MRLEGEIEGGGEVEVGGGGRGDKNGKESIRRCIPSLLFFLFSFCFFFWGDSSFVYSRILVRSRGLIDD